MGLGPVHTVNLVEARDKALQCRQVLLSGADPIEVKRSEQSAKLLAAASVMTFDDCAKSYIAAHRVGWKNAKHADQWQNTLDAYASPVFGVLPVSEIDTALIMRSLEPIWAKKPETASRVRGRIESILDWATVRGFRNGENPARWRGHLDKLLPARNKVKKTEHFSALPYAEIQAFLSVLRQQTGVAARGLEFLILTATRTNEVMGAQWSEIDMSAKIWTIPAERMKTGREHRVPLSGRAIDLLHEAKAFNDEFVFPGARIGKGLSNMAFLQLLRRMGRGDITAHGFRSTFRDWTAETTAYPREVCEMALAHTVGNQVEAAYRRGDLFEKRIRIMADWAAYCESPASDSGTVTPIRRIANNY